MSLDVTILEEFVTESKSLISQSLEILQDVESKPRKVKRLEIYGNNVDRIMGAAKSLAMLVDKKHTLNFVGDYCALCKTVGYKSSQITDSPDFLTICVAFLLDATEMLQSLIESLTVSSTTETTPLSETFLDRLRWVSSQFGAHFRETLGSKNAQAAPVVVDNGTPELADLMKKLGIN